MLFNVVFAYNISYSPTRARMTVSSGAAGKRTETLYSSIRSKSTEDNKIRQLLYISYMLEDIGNKCQSMSKENNCKYMVKTFKPILNSVENINKSKSK